MKSVSRLRTEIKQLKKEFESFSPHQSPKQIPQDWKTFAGMSIIRSGGVFKPFHPFGYQLEIGEFIGQCKTVIIAKARQLGLSEELVNLALHQASLNPGFTGIFISKNQADCSLLARRLKRMISGELAPLVHLTTDNLTHLLFANGSQLFFRNSKTESVRGIESVNWVIIDEANFLPNLKEIIDAASPALQMVNESKLILVSTPRGKTHHFWYLLNDSERDVESIIYQMNDGLLAPLQMWKNSAGMGRVLINWKAHPIYSQQANFLETIHNERGLDWASIYQEYCLSFHQEEYNVFGAKLVRECILTLDKKLLEKANYYLGIDSAGSGKDYFVCAVLAEIDQVYYLVDCYRNRTNTSQVHLFRIGEMIEKYQPIRISIETNAMGIVYLEQLQQMHSPYSFEGIATTAKNKETMIDRLLLAMEQSVFSYPQDSPIVSELLNFQKVDGKLGAVSGHDDVVMAVAIGLCGTPFAANQEPFFFGEILTYD